MLRNLVFKGPPSHARVVTIFLLICLRGLVHYFFSKSHSNVLCHIYSIRQFGPLGARLAWTGERRDQESAPSGEIELGVARPASASMMK